MNPVSYLAVRVSSRNLLQTIIHFIVHCTILNKTRKSKINFISLQVHGDLLLEELCVDPVRDPHLAPLQQPQDGHPARRAAGRVLGLQGVPGVPRRGTLRPRRPHALLPRAHPAHHVALGPHRLGAQGVRRARAEAGARPEPGGAWQVS